MIRLFHVYYPTRSIVLLLCEALIVSGSFLLATMLVVGPDTYLVLNYEYGGLKIAGLTVVTLLCSYYFDLYEPQRISARWEIYFRLLLVLGFLSFLLSAILYVYPEMDIARYVLLLGLVFLTGRYGGLAERVCVAPRKKGVSGAGLCSGCRGARADGGADASDTQGRGHGGGGLGQHSARQGGAEGGLHCRAGGISWAESCCGPRDYRHGRPPGRVAAARIAEAAVQWGGD